VIYHLSGLDQVAFVLGNTQNHLDGVGGPDRVTIALVVHGSGLVGLPRLGRNA
jgi:intracellular sulfur oxidation DsrE/DsrF family protein